jgi:hypothetical protein
MTDEIVRFDRIFPLDPWARWMPGVIATTPKLSPIDLAGREALYGENDGSSGGVQAPPGELLELVERQPRPPWLDSLLPYGNSGGILGRLGQSLDQP